MKILFPAIFQDYCDDCASNNYPRPIPSSEASTPNYPYTTQPPYEPPITQYEPPYRPPPSPSPPPQTRPTQFQNFPNSPINIKVNSNANSNFFTNTKYGVSSSAGGGGAGGGGWDDGGGGAGWGRRNNYDVVNVRPVLMKEKSRPGRRFWQPWFSSHVAFGSE